MQSQAFLADWRDRLAYPDERARPVRFAWECLRRSAAYAEAYAQRDGHAVAELGVARLHDPRNDEPPRFLRTCAAVRGSWGLPRKGALDGVLWIAFDPALPSEPQLASAERWAREQLASWHQRHPQKVYRPSMRLPRPRAIILALRVHDATAAEVPLDDVVRTLFLSERELFRHAVTEKRMDSARRQAARALGLARRLIVGGYRELALRDEYRIGDACASDDDLALPRFAAHEVLVES